jgi:hypothetical protein
MKALVPLFVLVLVGCGGSLTPADVAGIYDAADQDGEVVEHPEGGEYSLEFKPDGTVLSTLISPEMDISSTRLAGSFSVVAESDACIELKVWEWEDREEALKGTVCGDVLTLTFENEEDQGTSTAIWHKRH